MNVVVGTREAVEIVKFLKDRRAREGCRRRGSTKTTTAPKKEEVNADSPLTFAKIAASIPKIEVVDMGVTYKTRNVESKKFVTIGERNLTGISRHPRGHEHHEPRADPEACRRADRRRRHYLDVNIGPAESNGPELMTWAVTLLQENFNNVPLALDTANKKAIEAGIAVYNRTNGKPIVNSADAGSVSATSTWPPPTTPSSLPSALPTASPRTTTSA